jgi:CRP-like cAMP-binding protein
MKKDTISLLKNFFDSNLSDDDKVLNCFIKRKFSKNEFLLQDQELCSHVYFIINGGIRTYFINENEQEITQYVAFENEITTSFYSFINQVPTIEFL